MTIKNPIPRPSFIQGNIRGNTSMLEMVATSPSTNRKYNVDLKPTVKIDKIKTPTAASSTTVLMIGYAMKGDNNIKIMDFELFNDGN